MSCVHLRLYLPNFQIKNKMIFFVLCVHIRKTLEFNSVLYFHMTHVIIKIIINIIIQINQTDRYVDSNNKRKPIQKPGNC